MDPDETLRAIADAEELDDLLGAVADLQYWLRNDGFEPDWQSCPEGTAIFRTTERDVAGP
jgi:hypothetical protein